MPRPKLQFAPAARWGGADGNSRETAVTLTFEPEEVGYDPSERLMRFCAADGPFPVRCGVAAEVLAALQDGGSAGVATMLATYLRRKKLLQDILAQKYGAGLLERDGRVIVRLADLSAQAAADPRQAISSRGTQPVPPSHQPQSTWDRRQSPAKRRS